MTPFDPPPSLGRPLTPDPSGPQPGVGIAQQPAKALLLVESAWLFVSDPAGPAADLPGLLAATLQHLGVQAGRQRVVALLDEPALGRQYRVRVTPCLLLDTGARQVQLPGDPGQLDAAGLEVALARH